MSYSTCPVCKFAVEQYCSEKDAEIERKKKLITELADALACYVAIPPGLGKPEWDLVQRAREVTR
jgi:hypothetical protein